MDSVKWLILGLKDCMKKLRNYTGDKKQRHFPIPPNEWKKSLGRLPEDILGFNLNLSGIPCFVRVIRDVDGKYRGDMDLIVLDTLHKEIYIIEINNPSGNYPLSESWIEKRIINRYKKIEEWIRDNLGNLDNYKFKRIHFTSHLNVKNKNKVKKHLHKAHHISVVETGIQVIPESYRIKLPILAAQIDNGTVRGRAFLNDCAEQIAEIIKTELLPLIVPNNWEKEKMFKGIDSRKPFDEAIKPIKNAPLCLFNYCVFDTYDSLNDGVDADFDSGICEDFDKRPAKPPPNGANSLKNSSYCRCGLAGAIDNLNEYSNFIKEYPNLTITNYDKTPNPIIDNRSLLIYELLCNQ